MIRRATTTTLLVLAAGLAAGCGSDDGENGEPIPEQAAADLQSRLDEVERRLEAGGGACADIQNDTLPAIDSTIDSLPENVDPDLRDALVRSFERLFELTQEQCDEQKGQETEPEPAPVEPQPTETIPPAEEEEDDGEEEEEEPPPTEEAPTDTEAEPPVEVPPEEVPPAEGGSGSSGQGGSGTAGQGGSGTAGQGGGGGALVPEGGQ